MPSSEGPGKDLFGGTRPLAPYKWKPTPKHVKRSLDVEVKRAPLLLCITKGLKTLLLLFMVASPRSNVTNFLLSVRYSIVHYAPCFFGLGGCTSLRHNAGQNFQVVPVLTFLGGF